MSAQFTVKDTVQSMIDCNCPMVFYYTHSKPELKRIAHPILIVGKHVVCVESDTGRHKRFRLDGIKFPPVEEMLDIADENSQEIQDLFKLGEELTNVENTIREHVKEKTEFSFTYSFRLPWEEEDVVNEVKTVVPQDIKNGMMLGRQGMTGIWFLLEHIHPIRRVECDGCINDLANQQGHMGPGGCLSEERPSKKEPKIVSKRHAFDCGYGWNYDEDICNCGERGWAHCWYNDGHKEVLNWM
jgi:hypothetical protein